MPDPGLLVHRLGRLLAVVTLALLGAPVVAHAAPPAVPGQVVVGFEDGTTGATRERIRDAVDADVVRTVGDVQSQVLRVEDDPAAVAARLERRGAVAFAAPNYLGRVAAGPGDPAWFDTPAGLLDAWDYGTGDATVGVGIADTGVATHEDLPTFTGSTGDPNGHGTEVAGVLAARAGNAKGSAGVLRQADLRSYAPCDAAGRCPDAAVAAAITAAAADGVRVLNLSVQTLGVPEWPMTAAAIAAHEDDLLVVTAAGNGTAAAGSGRDVDAPGQASFPCATRKPGGTRPVNLVCVAASRGTTDGLYAFSNFGPDSVDLAAPGTAMTTTQRGGGYGTPAGTSIAAPFVTGVAALAFAREPSATPEDVRDALRDGVDPVPVLRGRTVTGGRLDALRTLALMDEGPPTTLSVSTTQATFSAPEPHSRFECRFGSADWTTCTSPLPLPAALEGLVTLRVRATDAAGKPGASADRTIDRLKPAITITAPRAHVDSATVDATFTVDDPTALVSCRVDGAAVWVACASPFPVTVTGEGPHTVEVRALDGANNLGTASRTFALDTTDPVVTATADDGTVTFDAVGDPSTYRCALDGGPSVPCASPLTLTGGGTHDVHITATDLAGNAGATETVTWTGTGTDPVVAIAARPPAYANGATAEVAVLGSGSPVCRLDGTPLATCDAAITGLQSGPHTFTITDGPSEQVAGWTVDLEPPIADVDAVPAFEPDPRPAIGWAVTDANAGTPRCTLDGVDVPCGTGTFRPTTDLTEGRHTFVLTPVDLAGNVGAAETRTWVHDITPPVIAGAVLVTGPGQVPDKPRFTWTAPADAAVTCSLDGAAPTTCRPGEGPDGVAAGPHRLTLRATDPAGNAATTDVDFTVDLANTLVVTAPPSGGTATTVTFTLGFPNGASRYEHRLDGGAWQVTTSPTVTLSGLAVGTHTVTARAVAPEPGDPVSASFSVVDPPPVVAEPTPSAPAPVVAPAPTPAPTASPKPTPTAKPDTAAKPASTSTLTKSVLRRYAKRSGTAAAQVKPFTLAYRATGKGGLRVIVQLQVGKRWRTVATGTRTYRRAGRDRIRIATSKAGAALLRKAGPKPALRVRSTFTPAG